MLKKIRTYIDSVDAYETCGKTKCVKSKKAYEELLLRIAAEYNALPIDTALQQRTLDKYRKKRIFNDLHKSYIDCLLKSCRNELRLWMSMMKTDVASQIAKLDATPNKSHLQKLWLQDLRTTEKKLNTLNLDKLSYTDIASISK